MSWEKTIALCYLQQADDERNKCLLTSEHFVVIYRGKVARFEHEQIKEVAFNQRRWLLPLIAGGITASFSLLAIFLGLYSLWPLFILFLIAALVFYWGWVYHPVLTVHDQVKEHDFPLSFISQNLRAFIQFTNEYLRYGHEMLYHVAKAEDWAMAQEMKRYEPTSLQQEGFIHTSSQGQLNRMKQSGVFSQDQSWVLLVIDPIKVHSEIRYEPGHDLPGSKSMTHELFPHIYGPLNLDAVMRTEGLFRNSS